MTALEFNQKVSVIRNKEEAKEKRRKVIYYLFVATTLLIVVSLIFGKEFARSATTILLLPLMILFFLSKKNRESKTSYADLSDLLEAIGTEKFQEFYHQLDGLEESTIEIRKNLDFILKLNLW